MADPTTSFAVVIPARNEAALVSETIAAVAGSGEIDVVVVVDDGSTDGTAQLAAAAGATVVRHVEGRGKAAALMTGADLVVRSTPPHHRGPGLVFLDADAGASAAGISALTRPLLDGELDLAIARYRARGSGGGGGRVVRLAGDAIHRRTGWRTEVPLSGIRALTQDAYRAVRPLAPGWGVETAMTIDAFLAGLRVGEVATTLTHRATGDDVGARLHRARQYVDVCRALARRPITTVATRPPVPG